MRPMLHNSLHPLVEFLSQITLAQHQQDTTVNILPRVYVTGRKEQKNSLLAHGREELNLLLKQFFRCIMERAAEGKKKKGKVAISRKEMRERLFHRVQIVIHVCISFLIIFLRAAPAHCAGYCSQQNRADAQVDIPTRPSLKRNITHLWSECANCFWIISDGSQWTSTPSKSSHNHRCANVQCDRLRCMMLWDAQRLFTVTHTEIVKWKCVIKKKLLNVFVSYFIWAVSGVQ